MDYNDDLQNGAEYEFPSTAWPDAAHDASQWQNAPAPAPPAIARPGVPRERPDAPLIYIAIPIAPPTEDITPEPEPLGWSEPLYSEAASESMYSPGISTAYRKDAAPAPVSVTAAAAPAPASVEKKGRFWLRTVCLLLVCAVISAAAAFGVLEHRLRSGDFDIVNQVVLGAGNTADRSTPSPAPVGTSGDAMLAQDIYDMATHQVVSIKTMPTGAGGGFGGFFGGGPAARVPGSSGSGFIISSDGYILTNFHVIETAYMHNAPLHVLMLDGTSYEARVVGYDADSDVAVIKIDATGLHPVSIANSDEIRVGQRVYAVGNPFGDLVYTMTEGIVSALERVVTVDGRSINTFQLSAAVNPGNSGGPVYDTNGDVIGIVTAKFMSPTVEGIGFAIPINDAIEIASELIEHGFITGRARIGITGQTVDRMFAEYFDWVEGIYIRSIMENSAAESAGLMVADIITHLGDARVLSMDQLAFYLRRYRAGDTTTITVLRAGQEQVFPITLDENPTAGQARPRG